MQHKAACDPLMELVLLGSSCADTSVTLFKVVLVFLLLLLLLLLLRLLALLLLLLLVIIITSSCLHVLLFFCRFFFSFSSSPPSFLLSSGVSSLLVSAPCSLLAEQFSTDLRYFLWNCLCITRCCQCCYWMELTTRMDKQFFRLQTGIGEPQYTSSVGEVSIGQPNFNPTLEGFGSANNEDPNKPDLCCRDTQDTRSE